MTSLKTPFVVGGRYNWKNQPERLIYKGHNFSGNGYWHQFAKIQSPEIVWCEVQTVDLAMFEETKDKSSPSLIEKEHITDGLTCWCIPEVNYTDPDTGLSVIVHKEPQ